ncbi:MAG: acetyl-CoA C-acyltransferase [Dehalococcoidia bacterium]
MNANGQNQPVILSAARTPVGRMQGSLSGVPAAELAGIAIRGAVERAGLPDPTAVDEVILGNVVSAGLGQNIARQSAMGGDLPASVGASTINKVCGASLKAVMLAAQAIKASDGQLYVVGGVESMSRAPHLVDGRRGQLRYGNTVLRDALVVDGLWCAFQDWAMGDAAEFIADEFEITRKAMDEYALASHQKAVAALDAGHFQEEIVPVPVPGRNGQTSVVEVDESPRRDTSLEALKNLRPAFRQDGRVTAGNAPGLNDAAAALVVSSKSYAEDIGAAPLARIVGYTQVAVDPKYIFAAPAQAIPKLLGRVGWTLDQVDLIELNEAFAAQILANGYALADRGWNWEKVNVNGGAIALGHPLGATGARLLTTLLYGLKHRGLQRGIASLCLGGGEAVALAVETC